MKLLAHIPNVCTFSRDQSLGAQDKVLSISSAQLCLAVKADGHQIYNWVITGSFSVAT